MIQLVFTFDETGAFALGFSLCPIRKTHPSLPPEPEVIDTTGEELPDNVVRIDERRVAVCPVCGYEHVDCYCAEGDGVVYTDELETGEVLS